MASFTFGTVTLNIPCLENFGGSRIPRRPQGSGMTVDGRMIIEDLAGQPLSSDIDEIELIIPVEEFDQSVIDSLIDFIENVIKWNAFLFTFTDDKSVTFNNCRMIFSELDIQHITNEQQITELKMVSRA